MRTPRVFLRDCRIGATVEAGARVYRHLVRVLRREAGDPLIVLDGEGGVYGGSIVSIDASAETLRIEISEASTVPRVDILPLGVAVGIPRGDALETAIRFASETGLASLQPLITARTVARPRAGSAKIERWRRIAEESATQCQRATAMEINDPLALTDYLSRHKSNGASRSWIAIPGGPPPEESGLVNALESPGGSLQVLIGPEGGFAPEEIELALESGLSPVGFRAPVLRTPTAIVYAATLAALCVGHGLEL